MNRLAWDDLFMSMSFLISMRSLDPSTKCGAIAVSMGRDILSMGFNSPPRDCDDSIIPLTRPEKYSYMAHAEENCIVNASRNGISLKGSTMYITSYPCAQCFRMMRNAGVEKIVFFSGNSANCVNAESREAIQLMNVNKEGKLHIEIESYIGNNDTVLNSLNLVSSYFEEKNGQK